MRVQILQTGADHHGIQPGAGVPAYPSRRPATYGPWSPYAVLGADAPGGLLLPPAQPTAAWLYAPRAVWLDDERVIVADTGNHRVLLWSGVPDSDGVAASVVLGQPDDHSEGPGVGPSRLNLPTGIVVDEGRLIVADAWNHRILVWDKIPTITGAPADHVIGQNSLDEGDPNKGGDPDATSFYWPFGIAIIDGRFYVADTGNRRVLCWSNGLPLDGSPADHVVGQPDPTSREENRGGPANAASFRWPHTVTAGPGRGIVVADAGNHRLLGWHEHPDGDVPADYVIGQPDVSSSSEFPYRQHDGLTLRFPYAAVAFDGGLAVADTADNRILLWDQAPSDPTAHPDYVLGQPTFGSIGENRWESVAADTLCWPYGLAVCGDRLAVADSGNNRVVLWRRS